MSSPYNESRPFGPVSPRQFRERAQSFSSDRPSTISHGLTAPPTAVSPAAAFIAETAASSIVATDHERNASIWYDQNGIEPSKETALISPVALQLVNGFLDQLLFNFLQVAKSTSLTALRPAVSEVLKPKLARETINDADEELREYLGDEDEDDYIQPDNSHNWDLELVWKRARLRCMVYSSLGDLEEDDEDMYMEQENLEVGANEPMSDIISPAVAIFLTSVLEHMGDMTLKVAGQVAFQRVRSRIERQIQAGAGHNLRADGIVIEESDMEKVALDRTLGRLWRGWKKRLRTPAPDPLPQSPPLTYLGSTMEAMPLRSPISGESIENTVREEDEDQGSHQDHTLPTEAVLPENIPLPLSENDVEEIEVPGLVHYSDEEVDEPEPESAGSPRPRSLDCFPSACNDLRIAALTGCSPDLLALHRRSQSLPVSKRSIFYPQVRSKKVLKSRSPSNGLSERQGGSKASSRARASTSPEGKMGSALKKAVQNAQNEETLSDSDESLEFATYEKAEVVTSSRVSVASSCSRSISDSGKGAQMRRSSSVHSVRIIDVPAPRSPAHSRPPSLDATERSRPASLSGPSSLVQSSTVDETGRAKSPEFGARLAGGARSPVDRMRPAMQNASTISESEEEVDERPIPISPSARSRERTARIPYGLQTSFKQTSPKLEQATPGSKVASLLKSPTIGSKADEQSSDVPRKSPIPTNWQPTKPDSKNMNAVERTRSREAEDDLGMPLHAIVPPRNIHTSGSTGSSGTGRLKAVRSSEDTSGRADSVLARNFEELIHSNQTITYTLTPENMRDIEVKSPLEAPALTKIARKSEDSRPADIGVMQSPQTPIEENHAKLSGPVPRAPSTTAMSSPRLGGSQARDARIPGQSIADFADFIKSTGPPGEAISSPVRSPIIPTSPMKQNFETQRTSVNNTRRSRYQPRDAVPDNTDNSELIDFIRQGPPPSSSGQHRIPRHVAPFRNTMDSDQFSGAPGGKAVDAVIPEIRYSQASTNLTDNSMPSMQSSVNSSSALLKNKPAGKPGKIFGEDDGMPVRKSRRARDPYALDFSDEEDDNEFAVSPTAPFKKEESLAEFLKNYEPPPEPVSLPMNMGPKKKSSAPSLLGRFTRSGSRDANAGINVSEARSLNSRTGSAANGRRPGAKHIPIQVNMPPGYDMYGPIDTTTTTSRPRGAVGAGMGRVQMRKYEPRDPIASSKTSDLAAFLRDSEPPSDMGIPHITRAEDANAAKMFGRRKKSSV